MELLFNEMKKSVGLVGLDRGFRKLVWMYRYIKCEMFRYLLDI